MTTLTAKHNGQTNRHHLTSRKDHRMYGIELRLAAISERQSLERSFRAADRAAAGQSRSIRSPGGRVDHPTRPPRWPVTSLGSPALTG